MNPQAEKKKKARVAAPGGKKSPFSPGKTGGRKRKKRKRKRGKNNNKQLKGEKEKGRAKVLEKKRISQRKGPRPGKWPKKQGASSERIMRPKSWGRENEKKLDSFPARA